MDNLARLYAEPAQPCTTDLPDANHYTRIRGTCTDILPTPKLDQLPQPEEEALLTNITNFSRAVRAFKDDRQSEEHPIGVASRYCSRASRQSHATTVNSHSHQTKNGLPVTRKAIFYTLHLTVTQDSAYLENCLPCLSRS